MRRDVRQVFRSLRKHPGFAIVSILVLALGVGANTSIFSIVNAVFFRPLPVHEPDRLMYIYWVPKPGQRPFVTSYRDFQFLREHNEAFSDLTFHWRIGMGLSADGRTDAVLGESVDANYFDVLGVKPVVGRTFSPQEDDPSNSQNAIVISHKLWQRRFESDPSIIGKEVRVDDTPFSIIGVTQPGFDGVSDPWRPSQFWVTSVQRWPQEYMHYSVFPIGRLKPGIGPQQAEAIIATQGEQLRKSRTHDTQEGFVALNSKQVILPFDPNGTVVPRRLAAALMVVVLMVLLIAAANMAGILIARIVTQRSEIAVHFALGASRMRVIRNVLTETIALSLLGGALGLWLGRLLLALFDAYTPTRYYMDIPLDFRVLLFAAAVCIVSGLIAGLMPAIQASKLDVAAELTGSGVTGHRQSRLRLRYWIVVPQIALSLALLIVAGLYVRVLLTLELADYGYHTDEVAVLSIRMAGRDQGEQAAERHRTFYRRLYEAIRAMPGRYSVAVTSRLPLTVDPGFERFFHAISDDAYRNGDREGVGSLSAAVTPRFFETMNIALRRGRDFDDRDAYAGLRTAIVSERLAARLWPGRDPLGRSVAIFSNQLKEPPEWLQVVGVASDVNPILNDVGETPFVYVPLAQQWMPSGAILVKSSGDVTGLIGDLKNAVAGADVYAEVGRVQTLNQRVAEILYTRRMAAGMLTVAGLIGLLLASIGIYGAISYSIAQRMREIGVRTALGAERRDIVALIIKEGASLAAIGSIFGLVFASLAIRIASRLVVQVPRVDVASAAAVCGFVAAVILLACWIPARRAARVDPIEILRGL